ncbi:hypothetical protein [Pseudomonas cremoris]|uniref:hypothetical protein n=1 Tax=Pseudomonas cremoris TaxID=2724178 RepID=UPI002898608A|nr:hypothetical protein [Pseudomonas cremoris]
MSVSALDKPVSNPPPRTPPPQPQPQLKSKDVSPSLADGQKADRVSFNSGDNKPGKVFAAQVSTTTERAGGNVSQGNCRQSAASNAQSPGFFDKFKQNLKSWCGGQRPPKPDPCPPPPCNTKPSKPPRPPKPCPPEPPKPDPCYGKPPERPTPCKPDPCYGKPPERPTPCKPDPCHGKPDPWYSNKSNDDLAKMLLNNFDAFKDPKQPWFINTQAISDMANKPLTDDASQDQNIRLARELMKRPELVNAIDRHSSTGALDGLIDRKKIEMTIGSQSPMKYLDDKQLAGEMLDHFKALRDPDNRDYISIDKLRGVAQWPTDDPVHGRLAWIAQEILKRSDTAALLDGGDHWGKDGWIHKDALRQMAR